MTIYLEKSSIIKYQNSKIKVGLLGGSFNPAHQGHLELSNKVMNLLNLDAIWWLVTPANPLKGKEQNLSFNYRYNSAVKLIHNNKIIISAIEKKWQLNYTIDTIKRLKQYFSLIKFVWLMGLDNLIQLTKWYKWQEIIKSVPVIIYNRGDTYQVYKALKTKASLYFNDDHYYGNNILNIVNQPPPCWGLLRLKKNSLSSTKIRENIII